MTIGNLLKKYRLNKEKTQREWIGNIISPSYYSKVEKGIHRISAEDLVSLLNYNSVSLIDFFGELNNSKQIGYNQEQELMGMINDAYYRNAKNELVKLKEIVNESDLPNKEADLLYLDAYIADINNEDLNDREKQALKDKIFSRPNFDKSTLVLYCNFMMFYDLESNVIISRGIIKQFQGSNDVKILEMILSVIGNLLIQCIEEKEYDETKFLVRAANQISTKPELFFYKNVIVLLENMIMYHYDAKDKYLQICHKLIENFSLLGMTEYGKEINKFFEKQK
ncbi:XRE family transcriptional regulator [Lactobacillus sp. ESL0260]|uniref:helix-turn-helix domain-containing protein n=1 Tax=Lactobacillus sp. ESL0260 TaxID=2069347 RepID=UPI000EFAF523|nr:helix-turn-helix transcriptional regulator [Lactobacillus sp. ESL0260]RMC60719.1 XRE family transcriptional regulator [Lactobacillus sp. ESL0260]